MVYDAFRLIGRDDRAIRLPSIKRMKTLEHVGDLASGEKMPLF